MDIGRSLQLCYIRKLSRSYTRYEAYHSQDTGDSPNTRAPRCRIPWGDSISASLSALCRLCSSMASSCWPSAAGGSWPSSWDSSPAGGKKSETAEVPGSTRGIILISYSLRGISDFSLNSSSGLTILWTPSFSSYAVNGLSPIWRC